MNPPIHPEHDQSNSAGLAGSDPEYSTPARTHAFCDERTRGADAFVRTI